MHLAGIYTFYKLASGPVPEFPRFEANPPRLPASRGYRQTSRFELYPRTPANGGFFGRELSVMSLQLCVTPSSDDVSERDVAEVVPLRRCVALYSVNATQSQYAALLGFYAANLGG